MPRTWAADSSADSTQGKVERFHQTLKKFLVAQEGVATKKQGGNIEIVGLDGSPLRRLVLDPAKNYQPQP